MKLLNKFWNWFTDKEPEVPFQRPALSLSQKQYTRLDIYNTMLTKQYFNVEAEIVFDGQKYRLKYYSKPLNETHTVNSPIISVETVDTGYNVGMINGERYALIKANKKQ